MPWVFPCGFSVKERIVVELRVPPGAPASRVSNFNFELVLLGPSQDRGSRSASLDKAPGLFIVSECPALTRCPPGPHPIFFLLEEPPPQPGPRPPPPPPPAKGRGPELAEAETGLGVPVR